ncbi:MAG: SIR2 family protein [bacterium]|nr:SIR2 family protein [bacterium]
MFIPDTLKQKLSGNRIIPFVGAGVSRAVLNKDTGKPLFPNWHELLLHAAERLASEGKDKYADAVKALLELNNPEEYLGIAERAHKGLGPAVWYEFLKEEFDCPCEKADKDSLKLAEVVWQLGSKLVITTNYDHVLRWACPWNGDLKEWDIAAPAEQADALRSEVRMPTLWHLHGHIDNKTEIILTPSSYDRLYASKSSAVKYSSALEMLRHLLETHTFLFIGFSLDDGCFAMQLKEINRIFEGATGPHYILAKEAEVERIKTLNVPEVEVIYFPDFGQPLLDLLADMEAIAQTSGTDSKSSANVSMPPSKYDPANTVFYVPYRQKGDRVIGREKAIQNVRTQLVSGKPTAIGQTAAFQGLGGLGKTQLAVEYAYSYRYEYPNGVIWLNADQDIDAQLIDLAEKAGWIAPESEHKYKLDVARRRLCAYSDCLIILDNLEDIKSIESYLPEPQANPHLLVTSRIEQPGFTPISLDTLSPDDALNLLFHEAGRKPDNEIEVSAARDIAKYLDGLPLALELAGAYLHYRTTVKWSEYLRLLEHSPKLALSKQYLKSSFTRHEEDLYTTLKIDGPLLQDEPRLQDILDLLTWSGSAPMGPSLMCDLLGVSGPEELTGPLGLGAQ